MLTTVSTIIGPLAGLIFTFNSVEAAALPPRVSVAVHGPAAIVASGTLNGDWQSDPKRYDATKDDPELKKLPSQLFEKYGIWIIVVAIVAAILSRKR
jgi:hypothetical protein